MSYDLVVNDQATATNGCGNKNSLSRFRLPVVLDTVVKERVYTGMEIDHERTLDEAAVQPEEQTARYFQGSYSIRDHWR